jgi:hypothetical protein
MAVPNDITSDVARVRLVLNRELETINTYEELARQATDPGVKAFFLHLALEEKEHVAEAMFLIRQLDADQNAHFAKDFNVAHFNGPAASAAAVPVPVSVLIAPKHVEPSAPTAATAAPVEHVPHIPKNVHMMVHALPAPPSQLAGSLTVGPLKRGRDLASSR